MKFTVHERIKNIVTGTVTIDSDRLPYNLTTDKEYSGNNVFVLCTFMANNLKTDSGFATFIQYGNEGFMVKTGEHGISLLAYGDEIDEKTGKEKSFRRSFTVFHSSQVRLMTETERAQWKARETSRDYSNKRKESSNRKQYTRPTERTSAQDANYRRIESLLRMTVANGCTVHEAQVASEMAERLRHKFDKPNESPRVVPLTPNPVVNEKPEPIRHNPNPLPKVDRIYGEYEVREAIRPEEEDPVTEEETLQMVDEFSSCF